MEAAIIGGICAIASAVLGGVFGWKSSEEQRKAAEANERAAQAALKAAEEAAEAERQAQEEASRRTVFAVVAGVAVVAMVLMV